MPTPSRRPGRSSFTGHDAEAWGAVQLHRQIRQVGLIEAKAQGSARRRLLTGTLKIGDKTSTTSASRISSVIEPARLDPDRPGTLVRVAAPSYLLLALGLRPARRSWRCSRAFRRPAGRHGPSLPWSGFAGGLGLRPGLGLSTAGLVIERATAYTGAITLLALAPILLPEMARGLFAQRVKPGPETSSWCSSTSEGQPPPRARCALDPGPGRRCGSGWKKWSRARRRALALKARYPYQVSCLEDRPCLAWCLAKRPPLAQGRLGMPEPGRYRSAAWMTLPGQGGGFTVVSRPHDLAGAGRTAALDEPRRHRTERDERPPHDQPECAASTPWSQPARFIQRCGPTGTGGHWAATTVKPPPCPAGSSRRRRGSGRARHAQPPLRQWRALAAHGRAGQVLQAADLVGIGAP